MCFCQGGEEPDPSAKAAAGWGLSGLPPCRPGEGQKETGGTGAAQARGGEGPTKCACWGTETKSEPHFLFMLQMPVYTWRPYLEIILNAWKSFFFPWCCHFLLCNFQTLEEEKERKSECLPPEPPADDPESVKIVFKLPNDTRVERRFLFGQSLTVSTTFIKTVHLLDPGGFLSTRVFQ